MFKEIEIQYIKMNLDKDDGCGIKSTLIMYSNGHKYLIHKYICYSKTNEHGIDSIFLKVYGTNGGIINIGTYNGFSGFSDFKSSEIGIINGIVSDDSSNISDNLESCEKTRHMVYVAISYFIDLCPWIKKFKLHDIQRRYCTRGEPTPGTNLSCFYIALFGQTWYEKFLNAKLYDLEKLEKYNSYIHDIYHYDKTKISWELFCSTLRMYYKDTPIINLDLIKEVYDKTKTSFEFFQLLKNKCNDIKLLSDTLEPWIDVHILFFLFEHNMDLLRSDWIFEVSSIPRKEYNVQKFSENEGNSGYPIL